jgi:hypothetical protein
MAAVAAAVGLVFCAMALAAPAKEPQAPSYAISNIVAAVMCAAVLAVPCKRFHRV